MTDFKLEQKVFEIRPRPTLDKRLDAKGAKRSRPRIYIHAD